MVDSAILDKWFALLDSIPESRDAESLYSEATPAGDQRRRNLRLYLELMASKRPKMMLLGEAPGYRGTSVTGVPFMSVKELCAEPGMLTGALAGDGFSTPASHIQWEATSGAMWNTLCKLGNPVPLLWATFPNHPFVEGDKHTNRKPRPDEIAHGLTVALALARVFGIERIVAVGRVAQAALAQSGLEVPAVRHPARGGAKVFEEQLIELLDAVA